MVGTLIIAIALGVATTLFMTKDVNVFNSEQRVAVLTYLKNFLHKHHDVLDESKISEIDTFRKKLAHEEYLYQSAKKKAK